MKQKNESTISPQDAAVNPQETSSQKKIHTAEGWMRLIKQKSSFHQEKEI